MTGKKLSTDKSELVCTHRSMTLRTYQNLHTICQVTSCVTHALLKKIRLCAFTHKQIHHVNNMYLDVSLF